MPPTVRISLHGEEPPLPTLLDVSTFMFDIALLYQLQRLALDPEYSGYTFTWNALRRNSRLLRSYDQLRVVKMRHESPIELVTVIVATGAAVAALWAFVQTLDRLAIMRMTHRKLALEILKLERELSKDGSETRRDTPSLRTLARPQHPAIEERVEGPEIRQDEALESVIRRDLEERGADVFVDQVESRLKRATIRIRSIDVVIEAEPGPPRRPESDEGAR